MGDVLYRIIASVVCAVIFCISTENLLGAMQQSGYKSNTFLRWLRRKGNMQFNRLCVLALCLALSTAVTSLCFSFVGKTGALFISAAPFLTLWLVYYLADAKYALKVKLVRTRRVNRLRAVYLFLSACISYIFIAALTFLSKLNGSDLYALIAYVPFAITPVLLPFILCLSNALIGGFENARNKKFVIRAGQVLNERKILRVGIVGSYGKTSVKNILKTLLSEKYAVVATPESYNTPVGIAKTVFSPEFEKGEVFIAEMGARKSGDIKELCALVKPDYAIFTGVCAQHISTFGSLENVFKEKSEILYSGAKVVCGEELQSRVKEARIEENAVFVSGLVKGAQLAATGTEFTLCLGGEEIDVQTKLLGNMAVENVALAATLAFEMGMTTEEIASGIKKLEQIPHRLQLIENNGVYVLDDGYNCNPRGATEAIAALTRFPNRKCIVTPGIVECGVLEEEINGKLGAEIAAAGLDKIILVGDTLVGAVKSGYVAAGGDEEKLTVVKTLDSAKVALAEWIGVGDCVLFLNDLPDVY